MLQAAVGKASFTFKNHTFNLAGSCPVGCDASDGVSECYEGCKLQDKIPLDNTYKTQLAAPAQTTAAASNAGNHQRISIDGCRQ